MTELMVLMSETASAPPFRAALAGAQDDLTFCRLDEEAFAASPSDSIDYAVMEHTDKAAVVPVDKTSQPDSQVGG